MRAIEVWTDEYKKIFYIMNPGLKSVKSGDITKRIELRKRLKCRSFRWYLTNVYPGEYRYCDKFVFSLNFLIFVIHFEIFRSTYSNRLLALRKG